MRSHLPRVLAPARAIDRLVALAADLPPPAAAFGFECRLGRGDEVDLGAVLLRVPAARGPQPIRRDLAESPAWRRIAAFARAWASRRDLERFVPFVFLEWDGRTARRGAAPSVFASIAWPLAAARRGEAANVAAAIPSLLLGAAFDRRQRARLTRCLRALPPGAAVLHVGAMLGRREPSARVELSLPARAVAPFLEAVGVEVEVPFPIRGQAQIALDLRASFERGPIGWTLEERSPRAWAGRLDALVKAGLCSAAKRRAVLAWPAAASGTDPARRVSHVKVTLAPGRRPEAKVYLVVEPNPAA